MTRNNLTTALSKIGKFDRDGSFNEWIRDEATNDERRDILQEAERQIKQKAGPMTGGRFRRWGKPEMRIISKLVSDRNYALNLMMQPTPNEVRRLEHLNDILLRRTLNIHQMEWEFGMIAKDTKSLREECDLDIEITYTGCTPDGWLRMDEDEYYGSDFYYMLNLQAALYNRDAHDNTVEQSYGDGFLLDGGTTWADGFLWNPEFEHICICHALHSLCTHICYPIPDALRMTSFQTEMICGIRG